MAIELYNVYHSALAQISEKKANIEVNICKSNYKIPLTELVEASVNIKNGAALLTKESATNDFGICSSLDLCTLELPFTGILATALHTLCFSRVDVEGFIVHQGATRKLRGSDGAVKKGVPESVDCLGMVMRKSGPGWPFFGAEGKREKLTTALKGMAAYANICSRSNDPSSSSNIGILGLATSTLAATLSLYVADSGHANMLMIKLVESEDVHGLALLSAVCAGCRHLCDHPLFRDKYLVNPEPFQDMEEFKILGSKCPSRTFKNCETVCKVFDTREEYYFRPNVEFLATYGGITAEEEALTKDNRIILLRYPFMKGDHDPRHMAQFLPICDVLDEMHKASIVHGDVRIENMIFGECNSYLIDFDMAAEKDSRYPDVFNVLNIPERHSGAKRGWKMLPSHDIHSLKYIISHKFPVKFQPNKHMLTLREALKLHPTATPLPLSRPFLCEHFTGLFRISWSIKARLKSFLPNGLIPIRLWSCLYKRYALFTA